MTNINSSEAAIDPDTLQLMLQLCVSPTDMRILLGKELYSSHNPDTSGNTTIGTKLSRSEIGILKAGGASGLEHRTSGAKVNKHVVLEDLIRECHGLVTQCYSLAEVAALLQISTCKAEALADRSVPRMHAFWLGESSLLFPCWQFMASSTIPGLEALLVVTGGATNPLVLSRFMHTENGNLVCEAKSLCPRDWLIRGLNPDPVLRLAQDLLVD